MKLIPFLLAAASLPAFGGSVIVSVDSTSGPWDVAANPLLPYGNGSQLAPTSVSSGVSFAAGNQLNIQRLDGFVHPDSGAAIWDGFGDPTYVWTGIPRTAGVFNDYLGDTGNFGPSAYMGPFTQDILLVAFVGAFADGTGAVVGNPFPIFNGGLFTVPGGATQLLLGFNDDYFTDNVGALRVQVSDAALPEPSTYAGVSLLLGGAMLYVRSKRRA